MPDSVQPHRQQPTRLPHPWDSPGKNTGVGCHFLLQCMKVKSESGVTQSCPTLRNPMDCSLPGSSIDGIFQARVLEWVAIAFSESYRVVYFTSAIISKQSIYFLILLKLLPENIVCIIFGIYCCFLHSRAHGESLQIFCVFTKSLLFYLSIYWI